MENRRGCSDDSAGDVRPCNVRPVHMSVPVENQIGGGRCSRSQATAGLSDTWSAQRSRTLRRPFGALARFLGACCGLPARFSEGDPRRLCAHRPPPMNSVRRPSGPPPNRPAARPFWLLSAARAPREGGQRDSCASRGRRKPLCRGTSGRHQRRCKAKRRLVEMSERVHTVDLWHAGFHGQRLSTLPQLIKNCVEIDIRVINLRRRRSAHGKAHVTNCIHTLD
jgi:hypothetical protein